MKTLYLDCGMGAAGDMLTAALLGLIDDREGFLRELNTALAGKAVVSCAPEQKCGVTGLRVRVLIDGAEEGERHTPGRPSQNGIREIRELLQGMEVPEAVRRNALAVFDSLAEAEAEVHGGEAEHIHFHELGTLDAVADVLAVCMLMDILSPDEVLASPVQVGGGTVKCAHGELPVPAPATERLLRGIPWSAGEAKTELCTPTGAALLRHFVGCFEDMPVLRVEKCGYGMGAKDFGRLNAMRAFLGERGAESDSLLELSCNLDDMTGEELGFALEELLRNGALDAWTVPIGMKKSRPGVLLACLCRTEQRSGLVACLFKHTTTLGVRETRCTRSELRREMRTVSSPLGEVRVKHAEGEGVSRDKAEFDDLARLAQEQDLSLREIRETLLWR